MRITVDANVLVRLVVRDDEKQANAAADLLHKADLIAVPSACLCEFVWVLDRTYDLARRDIVTALQALMNAANVRADRPAFEAGLETLEAGGDFADGVIAHQGSWLGGETFVSFDKKAVAKVAARGVVTQLLDALP